MMIHSSTYLAELAEMIPTFFFEVSRVNKVFKALCACLYLPITKD